MISRRRRRRRGRKKDNRRRRRKKIKDKYLEVHDLRTVGLCRQSICSSFKELFKAVERQLEHSGHDGGDERCGVAGQNGDGCEVSGQKYDPARHG
jgi:hypothetical protein